METSGEPRVLTAPLRFVWHMALWAIFLLASPLLFVGVLVFGLRIMSNDEIWLTKVLLVVLGPFALTLWWIVVRRVSHGCRAKWMIVRRSRTDDDYTDAELRFLEHVGKPRHFRNFVVLIVSLAGSIYCGIAFQKAGDMHFFSWVLAGILSPAIIVAAMKALFGF
jgi:hypothetical protein